MSVTVDGARPTWVRHNRFFSERCVPGTTVALLSRPEKMPGPSWSLPAGPACPYLVDGANSICGSCYANGGRYVQSPIVNAQRARFEWTRRCMRTAEGRAEFVAVFVEALGAVRNPRYWYMRVHDSGDLFSEVYTRCWARICAALPHFRFWFPTRSWRAPWLDTIVELNALPNVTVRPSALHFGAPPPMIEGLAAGTTVLYAGFDCESYRHDNTCGPCRRCWDVPERPTSYHAITPENQRRHGG